MSTAMKVAPDHGAHFLDISGKLPDGPSFWSPVKVPRSAIEAQIKSLANAPQPAHGRRAVSIVHPSAVAPGLGFAPGVEVMINVLNPGEATEPLRRNANQVNICIAGGGSVTVKGRSIPLGRWDVCNIPSMQAFHHSNSRGEPWVWLSYSNAPLLEKLGVNYFEANPAQSAPAAGNGGVTPATRYVRENAPDFEVGTQGARLRGYEFLTDIAVVENHAHHWPYANIAATLSQKMGDDKRGIILLYNPATERRNGTTHSFFVTCSSHPPGTPPRKVGRGHRHSSVAINYHFRGRGMSIVEDQCINWEAGDLLLSAPGWSEHAHYVSEEGAEVFTVQDHPLHIGMESLVWQESMEGPILALGSETGSTGYIGPRERGA